MRRFQRGLIVGKFSPLHRGHMSVIDAAFAACDEVFILSYSKPELPGCPSALRDAWLRELYPSACVLVLTDSEALQIPHNDAPATDHRQFVGWVCEHLFDAEVDAVFTSEDYGDGFAAELHEYFVARGRAREEAVAHVTVDMARVRIPTSGTAIRQDPHALRTFLDPRVYASFVQRVAVLGGESSGKTTLCAALAEHFDTRWVPEYGRDCWVKKDGMLEFEDMLHIGQVQHEWERECALSANRWLFCDTTPLTTLFYSLDLFGPVADELARLATQRYAHVFLCAPDIPFVQDGTRRDQEFRCRQHEWYQEQLTQMQMPYTVLAGALESRVQHAISLLSTLPSS